MVETDEHGNAKFLADVAIPEPRELKCPFCHHDRFKRTTIDEVKMVDDGESITDELSGFTVEIRYVCVNCGTDVTNEELEG